MKFTSLFYTLLALLIFTFSADAASHAKDTIPPVHFSSYYLEIYGGKTGYHTGEPNRVKLTLLRQGVGDVAEIYFYDKVSNVPPTSTALTDGHYVLRFPMSTLGPILQQLRFSQGRLSLEFIDGEWCIRSAGEPIVHPAAKGTSGKRHQ